MVEVKRCDWCLNHPLYITYHDTEWGVPLHDDEKLFEFLILEGMQAGLSWLTVLKKRDAFLRAFHGFDAEKIARLNSKDVEKLMQNASIIRNRRKIESVITNAQAYLSIREKQSFNAFIWQFVDGVQKQNAWDNLKAVPASTTQSDAMAKTLKQHQFKFVGTTICYAFMQATGMVNDHLVECYRYDEINNARE